MSAMWSLSGEKRTLSKARPIYEYTAWIINCAVFVRSHLLPAGQRSLSCLPNSYLRHRD